MTGGTANASGEVVAAAGDGSPGREAMTMTADSLFLEGLQLGEEDPYAQLLADAVVKYNYRSDPAIVRVFSEIFLWRQRHKSPRENQA